jgi:hypothetical protein
MTKTAARMLRLMDRAVTTWTLPVIGRQKGHVLRRLLLKHRPRRTTRRPRACAGG